MPVFTQDQMEDGRMTIPEGQKDLQARARGPFDIMSLICLEKLRKTVKTIYK
jgi:hypothetical protein